MSAALGPARIRRILIALDASAQSLAALEQAAALAARLDAELLGLFVEDINLLRLAGLPFAREIGAHSARTRRLDDAGMERTLRVQARRAQQALSSVSERLRVQCSFRVARGQVGVRVLEAAHDVDLVTIALARRRAFSPTARAVMAGAPRPLLLLQQGAGLRSPVLVIYDGSAAADRALDVARQLAQALGGQGGEDLSVLIPEREYENLARLKQEIDGFLEQAGLSGRIRPVNADPASIMRAVRMESAGTLVLTVWNEEGLHRLLAEADCAVLLVR